MRASRPATAVELAGDEGARMQGDEVVERGEEGGEEAAQSSVFHTSRAPFNEVGVGEPGNWGSRELRRKH